jgi:hypothetical protein
MKFSHVFRDVSSTRLSQFSSDTEKFVPYGFQESSQMNTNRSDRPVTDWLNGMAAYFCDDGKVKLMERMDKCLNRNGDYIEK